MMITKKTYLIGGIFILALAVFVSAQFVIPNHLNIGFDINIPSKFEGHGFGRCEIENPAYIKMIGYKNTTNNYYYFTPSAGFAGKCVQGMGWINFSLQGINTLQEFKNTIKTKTRTRALYIYNLDTNLSQNKRQWNTGS